jgi:hypothetical protein
MGKATNTPFKVNRKKAAWSDFATGEKGDMIALVAYVSGTAPLEAARELASLLGVPGAKGSTSLTGNIRKPAKNEKKDTHSCGREPYRGRHPARSISRTHQARRRQQGSVLRGRTSGTRQAALREEAPRLPSGRRAYTH